MRHGQDEMAGYMAVYIDDLLITGDRGAVAATLLKIRDVWHTSDPVADGDGGRAALRVRVSDDDHGTRMSPTPRISWTVTSSPSNLSQGSCCGSHRGAAALSEAVKLGDVQLQHVPGQSLVADGFTKQLGASPFGRFKHRCPF